MVRIPEEKIAEVREATDIVELISGYVTLKKRGKSYFGLCPFHHEDTPSFSVDPVRQMYHCFGCHKGGNAITFLMDYEKLSFLETVELLAEKSGIALPRVQTADDQGKEKESLYFANKFAARFYYDNLMSPAGKVALDYMMNRGFDQSVIKSFGLGYSPPEWDALIKHAQRHSVNPEILFKAGLLVKKEGGGYYDRFRGRVMIPIINLSQKVVGFGGRIIVVDDKSPKYLNTPETPVYQKSQILFGLFRTREDIRKEDIVIFVEGYTDLLSLYMRGIKHVVATSGTALTTGQAQLIKRYTQNILLLYDADAAGSAASMRGADIFLSEGLNVKIIALPQGHDPDSYIRQYGREAFTAFLGQAVSFIQFKIGTLSRQADMKDSTARARVIQSLLDSIARIKDKIKKGLALKEVAEYFGMDERLLLEQLRSVKPGGYDDSRESSVKTGEKKAKKSRYDIAEETIIRVLLSQPEFIGAVMQALELREIRNGMMHQLGRLIFEQRQKGEKINERSIMNMVSEAELMKSLSEIVSIPLDEEMDKAKLLNDCLISIKERELEEKLQQLVQQMKDAGKQSERMPGYMQEYTEMKRTLAELKLKIFVTAESKA